jgi:hypothetical protein
MPTLNIEGRNVTVDDSFLKLSPNEQNSTVDEIKKSLGPAPPIHIGAPDGSVIEFPGDTSDETIKSVMAKHYPAPVAPAKASADERAGEIAADVAKSGGVGLAKGAIGLAGTVGDWSDILAKGSQKASNFIADKIGIDRGPQAGDTITVRLTGVPLSAHARGAALS